MFHVFHDNAISAHFDSCGVVHIHREGVPDTHSRSLHLVVVFQSNFAGIVMGVTSTCGPAFHCTLPYFTVLPLRPLIPTPI